MSENGGQKAAATASHAAGQAAFTMVEVALALAVIAFALVAIIGILPIGMNVQKENREETIINQDARVLMEAIGSGAKRFDDLTNYVDAIWITKVATVCDQFGVPQQQPTITTNFYPGPISSGFQIVGLMSTPTQYLYDQPRRGWITVTNIYVNVYMRAMSGSAVDKYPQANPAVREGAFSYKLICEVVPYGRFLGFVTKDQYPIRGVLPGTNVISRTLENNIHELRLTFRWPLLPNGNTGFGRQTFRTRVGGRLVFVNDTVAGPLYFFDSGSYTGVP